MIGTIETGMLKTSVMSGFCYEGLTVKTKDGKPARLAIVDENGNIIEDGPEVANEAWNVAIATYKNFLIGKGYIRVHTTPTGIDTSNVSKKRISGKTAQAAKNNKDQ